MDQDYSNHSRVVPLYHHVLALLLVATLIGAAINFFGSLGTESLYSASLILVMSVSFLILGLLARTFALKAQDRAIRVEENLRHFVLTEKLIDPRVTMRQVIGLRFASDGEFLQLANRAAEENLSEGEIKKAIKDWRADHERV